MGNHVGYWGRKMERFRYDGDNREVSLEISAAAADALVSVMKLSAEVARGKLSPELSDLEFALRDMGFV